MQSDTARYTERRFRAVDCEPVRCDAVSRSRRGTTGTRADEVRDTGHAVRAGRGRGRRRRLPARRSRFKRRPAATSRADLRQGERARSAVVRVSGRPPEYEFRDGRWLGGTVGGLGTGRAVRRSGGSRRTSPVPGSISTSAPTWHWRRGRRDGPDGSVTFGRSSTTTPGVRRPGAPFEELLRANQVYGESRSPRKNHSPRENHSPHEHALRDAQSRSRRAATVA